MCREFLLYEVRSNQELWSEKTSRFVLRKCVKNALKSVVYIGLHIHFEPSSLELLTDYADRSLKATVVYLGL